MIGTRRCSNIVRNMHRVAVLLASGAAVVLGVSSCSAAHDARVAPAVVTQVRGLPPSVTEPPGAGAAGIPKPFASWAVEPGDIYVTTWGSSTCPKLPTSVHATGAHGVQITTARHYLRGENVCTSDFAPTTSTVRLPREIAFTAVLAVTIDGTVTELRPIGWA